MSWVDSALPKLTPFFFASSAPKDFASVIISLKGVGLRPLMVDKLSIRATRSFKILFLASDSLISSFIPTGVAAPMVDPGDITIKSAAALMIAPALAALAPLGATQITLGAGCSLIAEIISFVVVTSPPGVFIRMMTRVLFGIFLR